MANGTAKTYPSTGLFDIARLVCGLVFGLARHPRSFSPGRVISNWIWGVTRRRGSENIVVNLGIRKLLLVTGKDLSKHILDQPPNSKSYIAGPSKSGGMSFLATQGLTICHDERWERLRPMNDRVLSINDDPPGGRGLAFTAPRAPVLALPSSSASAILAPSTTRRICRPYRETTFLG